jgi:hypothetical protein
MLLMVLCTLESDIPESTMKPVMEEFQAELERKLADKDD